ncbi:alpha-mannosidase [Pullulanibacillus pueri]|uniref:Alpha-mannosidase n=1 Tax=Pullulanibacillus pueri TaxID=1437324 RepID=A0A8J3ELF5_9BACL|nr:alpha-mannosidase [Pullulanibacillus pueri]MBM7680782.1 alpha-mannosidase [Pullulanibacillus pueri]GGH78315.1 alpha-mannosidase [Pullulanibacillus pueri]
MFWTDKKLAARVRELDGYRYRERIEIPSFQFQLDEEGKVGERPPIDGQWSTLKIGDQWSGRDLYAWLAAKVEIPEDWQSRTILGLFDFGKTDGGTNAGFESLLYINGAPYQGVDGNHQEVFLSHEMAGKSIDLVFRLWSGLEGGGKPVEQVHKISRAQIAWLDEATDDLYFTAKASLQAVEMLDEHRPEREDLLGAVNRAFNLLDWTSPGSDEFYQTVQAARDSLQEDLERIGKHHPVTIHAIGHTHIDVAWLWRLKHTREKAARSFSTVLRLMERYPDYIFQQGQPQLYDYVKTDYPEIYEQIRKRVAEGRWEADGGMWLEPDCNLPSGESFVRQLLKGTRFFRDEFGVECTYLWLPDVFGYSWALPQILKKSGIKTFATTKISWNQYNRMPHDTFKWRGIDGTEILTYFIATPYPGRKGWGADYNAQITGETVQGVWEAFKDKELTKDLLISYGYGDGGGGVTREMLEMRRRLDKMPGMPKVINDKAGDYFDLLHNEIESTDRYVHTWDGELYLEYHRGTFTSQAYNKKTNRQLELLYRQTELLSVLASLFTDWSNYPTEKLNEGWKIILRNQFHDIIPGSSINEVYKDSREEYAEALQLGRKSHSEVAAQLTESTTDLTYTIVNDASWARTSYVQLPIQAGKDTGSWVDNQGNVLKSEKTETHWVVKVDNVPAMGLTTIHFKEGLQTKGESEPVFTVGDNKLETPYYVMEWNAKGQLTRIFDRAAGREVLKENERGNILQIFEDKPLRFDAWDIDMFYQEKMKEITELKRIEVVECNSLYAVVRFTWSYHLSEIKQDLKVYAHNPRIEFKTHVDWHETHQMLKVAFPVDIRSTEATFDIQFGNVKRPTHWNTSWDYAKFETVGHQWADLSERDYGVSLLNDSKYGYDIKDSTMRLTLLRSATYPDHSQDQGQHTFTYALLPHQGDWVAGRTVQEAWDLNQPLSSIGGQVNVNSLSLFQLSVDHVVIDAIKKAEDEDKLILRLHEFTGKRGTVEVKSDLQVKSWQETDLMERPIEASASEGDFSFSIKPYEIKTFLVDLTK